MQDELQLRLIFLGWETCKHILNIMSNTTENHEQSWAKLYFTTLPPIKRTAGRKAITDGCLSIFDDLQILVGLTNFTKFHHVPPACCSGWGTHSLSLSLYMLPKSIGLVLAIKHHHNKQGKHPTSESHKIQNMIKIAHLGLVYFVDVMHLFFAPSMTLMSKVLAAVGNWVCSSAASAPSFAAVSPKRDTGAWHGSKWQQI